jgi:hypothetical protein
MSEETAPATVREGGRFVKGQSGNPNGRPPGKQTAAAYRKRLELALLEHVGEARLKRIILKVAEQAEAGDKKSQKLILDKFVSNAGPGDDTEDTGRKVVFVIENATFAAQTQQALEHKQAIDVTVTDVTEQKQKVLNG